MPRGNGTGPGSQGPGTGRGQGPGKSRMDGPFSAGPGGHCICPKCGTTASHLADQPCSAISCPNCGTTMTRG